MRIAKLTDRSLDRVCSAAVILEIISPPAAAAAHPPHLTECMHMDCSYYIASELRVLWID